MSEYKVMCEHCGRDTSFSIDEIPELATFIEGEEDIARSDGCDDGFDDAERDANSISVDESRASDMRLDVYRAIYRGDIAGAVVCADLMSMVGADRDEIYRAKLGARK